MKFIVSLDDFFDNRMSDHISLIQFHEADALHVVQYLDGIVQTRFLIRFKVNLGTVPIDDQF